MQIYNEGTLLYADGSQYLPDIIQEVPRETRINRFCRFHRKCNHHQQCCRKKIERIVFKTGHFNVEKSESKFRVFPDIVKAFVEAQWRWSLFYCFFTYVSTWLAFAAIWWIILFVHGDFEPENLPHINGTAWTPCVREIYDFTSVFLFSIEIHTTIGYGKRSLTLECPEAMFVMCIESILGTFIQAFLIGIVFAKLTRPKNRAHTIMFSKHAIINQRDRDLCLTFRIGNTRKSRIIAVNVQAYLIQYVSRNGDHLNHEQIKLDLKVDSSKDVFFMFPISAMHKIDENSPFYCMSAYDMLNSRIEILVVFEGTIESTGQPVQAKSSYTSHEILWGHRFVQLLFYSKKKRGFVIDFSKFDETHRIDTPLCSAKELQDVCETGKYLLFSETVHEKPRI